ncbi:hypothetical protein ACWYXK_26650 [Janthinobacterium lividum]
MRDLGQTMTGLQAAADRACLVVYRGDVWKHQRLPRELYPLVEFIVGEPQEGSYIIEFFSDIGGAIVQRIRRAIEDPYASAVEEGGQEIYTLGHQIGARKDAANNSPKLIEYEELKNKANPLVTRSYADKSISKEIGQMLNPVMREKGGHLKLVLKDSDDDIAHTYEFDYDVAKRFKKIIGSRVLSEPVIYKGIVRELDKGADTGQKKFRGKFINSNNKKTVTIHIEGREDFSELVPYLDKDEPFQIVASPIIEFDSFDPVGGDIQFLKIYHG